MTKPKSLFKLTRNKIFEKGYLCEECNNLDQNFIQKYGEYYQNICLQRMQFGDKGQRNYVSCDTKSQKIEN